MAERRNERAGRARSARSSRSRPASARPASPRQAAGRRPRNPAPTSGTGPITDAISLDLIGEDGNGPFDDSATAVLDVVADDSDETSTAQKAAAEKAAAEKSGAEKSAARRARLEAAGRAPAAALAARWHRLNPRRAIVLAVVLGFVALTLAVPLRTYFSQRAELDQVRAANAAVERENAELTRKVNEQGDPAYVEAQARARLRYVRPGEIPFVLEIPGRDREAQERRRAAERAANPWYANLWDSVSTPPAK
ncbi:FtsB family cell division protein [Gordonia crocea]|uniref:Septum formation initiator n=1 Tax=Gordonia crocea TaxID=589162 RepID=A0A7I9UVX5_9ACTN|nr:septum formation initiator family protein [Gordonia crocea]GED97092.1 hypothetical protein nbrc107697_11310 [Gordonia crocea]